MKHLRALMELNDSLNSKEVLSKLKAAETANVKNANTKGFALEDDKGKTVKVRVPTDQAEEFEKALAVALDNRTEEKLEIAEVLFNLKEKFNIIDVQWGEGSIPEDEETDNKIGGDEEPVDADVESEAGEFPGGEGQDELGGEEGADGEENDNPMQADDMMGDADASANNQAADAFSALTAVIDMLKSDAEARKTEAEAKKAEASVEAGRVAAQAASSRTKSAEEILDMENHNKRGKEEKRQRDLQAKLIRYRHELQNPSIGESVMNNEERMFPDATPEEEEVLDMEKWEREKKEREQREKTHERLKKYRHSSKHEEEEGKPTFKSFLKRDAENVAKDKQTRDQIDLSHRSQR